MPLRISFYREDHAGPFPPGFVGFVRDVGARASGSQFYCGFAAQKDWPCYVDCEVAGDQQLGVQLSRLGSNLDEENIQAHTDVFALSGDHEVTAYKLAHNSSGDSDFRCTARSSTRQITKTISVNFVAYPKIDRELSTITKYENGSLQVTCVATGRPAPSISFFQSNAGYPQSINPDDYDVTEIHVDDSTTRAELLFRRKTSYRVYHVDCTAENNPDREDFYVMYVDDYLP